jgi:hypothetical protein
MTSQSFIQTSEYIAVAGKNGTKRLATEIAYNNEKVSVHKPQNILGCEPGVPHQPIHEVSWLTTHAPSVVTSAVCRIWGVDSLDGENQGLIGSINRLNAAASLFRIANPELAEKEVNGEVIITAVGIESYLELRKTLIAPVFDALLKTGLLKHEWYNKIYDWGLIVRGYDKAAVSIKRGLWGEIFTAFSEEVRFPSDFIRMSLESGQVDTVGSLLEDAKIIPDGGNPHPKYDKDMRNRIDFLVPTIQWVIDQIY